MRINEIISITLLSICLLGCGRDPLAEEAIIVLENTIKNLEGRKYDDVFNHVARDGRKSVKESIEYYEDGYREFCLDIYKYGIDNYEVKNETQVCFNITRSKVNKLLNKHQLFESKYKVGVPSQFYMEKNKDGKWHISPP